MKLLFINSCIRKESRTKYLADYFINKYSKDNIEIEEIDLKKINLKPLLEDDINKRTNFIENNDFSDSMFDLAKKFISADKIIIAAPYWDLSFPSILKVFVEHICVNELSFRYERGKSIGLSNFSSLLYISTSGGYQELDGINYITNISNFLGNGKVFYVKAEGLDVFGNAVEKIIDDSKKELDKILLEF